MKCFGKTTLFGFLTLLASGATVSAGTKTVCVRFEIQTSDSGASSDSLKEDHYLDTNSGATVIARGVRINVSYGGASVTNDVNTDPSTGCRTFSHTQSGPFSVRVYARAS